MRRTWIVTVVVTIGVALGGATYPATSAGDPGLARALSRAAGAFGWAVDLVPPGRCARCKARLELDVGHEARADLDQAVRIGHDAAGAFLPHVEVVARTDGTGGLQTSVAVLEASDDVAIAVPRGYKLVLRAPSVYTLVPEFP